MALSLDPQVEKLRADFGIKRVDEIAALDEYMEWRRKLSFCWFRGVSREDYQLVPRIGRGVASAVQSVERFLNLERLTLDRFKLRARPWLDHVPSDDWEWLTLMQHHGAPTRLLDWTTNALVALFFACCENEGEFGRVYARSPAVPAADMSTHPFKIAAVGVVDPVHMSYRVAAQSGVFTAHPLPWEPLSDCFSAVRIDPATKSKLMDDMESLGITRAAMFPGLDSVAADVSTWARRFASETAAAVLDAKLRLSSERR